MKIVRELDLTGTEVDIILPEKTSLDLTVYIKSDGEAFELAEGDTVQFMVKKDKTSETPLLAKTLEKLDLAAAKCRLRLTPADTALAVGRYWYSIHVESGEDRWPVMSGRFVITEAVY